MIQIMLTINDKGMSQGDVDRLIKTIKSLRGVQSIDPDLVMKEENYTGKTTSADFSGGAGDLFPGGGLLGR